MLSNEIVIKRLALIKHLYKAGVDQSQQPEIIAWSSVLSLHDSIEMFLKLLAEHKDIKSENFNFLDYWTNISTLTLKESMRNLNARRVNIKHKGLLPSKSDIEISRVNTTDFFDQNTKTHFGFEFKDISLLTLIKYEEVRIHLENAQKSLETNNTDSCIELTALAFEELINSYEKSKTNFFSNSPYFFGKDFTFLSSFHIGVKENKKMAEFVDKVKGSLDGIQKAVKVLSLGIDYKRYVKFQLLTPKVTRTVGGKYYSEMIGNKILNNSNCQFCIDFVLDSAIKLQEFDFDISELIENERPVVSINEKSIDNNIK